MRCGAGALARVEVSRAKTLRIAVSFRCLMCCFSRASAPAPHETMSFSLDHIGIAVKSLAQAKAIYEKLGLPIAAEEVVPDEKVRVVMVPVENTRIELLQATSDDSPIANFIAKRGGGLHHVCLRVPDLSAAVKRLKADGVRLVSDEIKTGAGGHRYIFIHPHSAGGVLVELVES